MLFLSVSLVDNNYAQRSQELDQHQWGVVLVCLLCPYRVGSVSAQLLSSTLSLRLCDGPDSGSLLN